MATYSRYWILVSVLAGLLGSCSSDATSPVAVNPEAVSSVEANVVEGTQLSADLSRQVEQAEAMDPARVNLLPEITFTDEIQRLPFGNTFGRLNGNWLIGDRIVVVQRAPRTEIQVEDPVVGDTVTVTAREFTESIVIATVIAEPDEPGIIGTNGNDILLGTAADDIMDGRGGNDTIDGRQGADQIATGSGNDTVVYNGTQLGSGPDQLSDWAVNSDRFLLNAGDFNVAGSLSFINTLAVNLPSGGVNVIVLQDTDNDNDPNTAFNARSAAQLIGAEINQIGPGFFIYWNSGLGVNRLVFSADLSNGEAALTVLSAINTLSGQDAINALPSFSASNFAFENEIPAPGGIGTNGNDVLVGTDADDTLDALGGNDTIDGRGGADLVATGSGNDTVIYNSSQLGSGTDQLSDWSISQDRFLLNAADFGISGRLLFINALAGNLPGGNVNVIVLQDTDNDNDPNTAFNARSAARLIGAAIDQPGPGFFIYWNSGLGVNRLVFTPDLSNGEAALTVLSAINTLSGQDAINALPTFSVANFAFN